MKSKLLLFIAAFSLFASSCTYEDGPKLSLRSKKSRLMGKWLRESPEVMAGSSVFTEFKDDNKMTGGGTYTDLNGEVQAYSSNHSHSPSDE